MFILPFPLLFLAFQLIPTIWTFYVSLTNWKGVGAPKFREINSYRKLLVGSMFWDAPKNTVIHWITGLVLILIPSVLITGLLNSDMLKGKAFFRTVTFPPNICAAIAMGLMSKMLFDKNVGLSNEFLSWMGLGKVPWLISTQYSRIPVIMLDVWKNTPRFTIIVLSGLLDISRDYYGAVAVDGASEWKQLMYITLPFLGDILFFCSITLTVDNWKFFNESYILPGPNTSNTSLFQYMYESGSSIFNMGYTSAIGVILTLILTVLSVVQMVVKRRQGELQGGNKWGTKTKKSGQALQYTRC